MTLLNRIICLVALLPLGAHADGVLEDLNANNDHGFWFDQNVNIKLPCDWTLLMKAEQRLGSDYRKFWYETYQILFQYDLTKLLHIDTDGLVKRLSIGPGYEGTWRVKKNTESQFHWVWVNRYQLEANLGIEWRSWQLNQRLRGGYHQYVRQHYKDFGNFRYRITVTTPWKWTCYHITPYVSNEWFFKNNTYHKTHPDGLVGGWNQNRFRIGMTSQLREYFTATLYWQWRALKQKPGSHPRWKNNYIFGVSLEFDL